ncbi:MAG: CoA pyrophosphatase [Desulfobacterales bacterium]|nr:CoA pyrophosphatase [Desulfobacterales bacterium]
MKVNSYNLKENIKKLSFPQAPKGRYYKPTSVFLLLFFKEQEPYILAILKADREGYLWRNQVALPGGHIDKSDTTPMEAAFRELKEELGIPKEQVDEIGSIGHFPTLNQRDIEVFLGLWNGEGPIVYDRDEIAEVLEIPLKELLFIHNVKHFANRYPDMTELVYPFNHVVIWGATARIIHHFIENVYPLL